MAEAYLGVCNQWSEIFPTQFRKYARPAAADPAKATQSRPREFRLCFVSIVGGILTRNAPKGEWCKHEVDADHCSSRRRNHESHC
jgi:hypothetical protein